MKVLLTKNMLIRSFGASHVKFLFSNNRLQILTVANHLLAKQAIARQAVAKGWYLHVTK